MAEALALRQTLRNELERLEREGDMLDAAFRNLEDVTERHKNT
jgi:hypothetical protein